MKKLFFLLILISAVSVAQATLVNGDFEAGSTGWTQWHGGNSAVPVVDPYGGDQAANVWWSDDGMFQDFTGFAPGVYTLTADIANSSDFPLLNRTAIVQAEMGDGPGVNWWSMPVTIDDSSTPGVWNTLSIEIDLTDAANTWVRVNMFLIDTGAGATGAAFYDNITFEPVPEPASMALLGLGALVLRRRK